MANHNCYTPYQFTYAWLTGILHTSVLASIWYIVYWLVFSITHVPLIVRCKTRSETKTFAQDISALERMIEYQHHLMKVTLYYCTLSLSLSLSLSLTHLINVGIYLILIIYTNKKKRKDVTNERQQPSLYLMHWDKEPVLYPFDCFSLMFFF